MHGVSNQGGALLTVLMGSLYSDKEKIRTNISFAYLLFGLSQLVTLLWVGVDVIGWMSIAYACVTLIIYLFFGRFLFKYINMGLFNLVFTILMVVYGVLLLFPLALSILQV